MASLCCNCRCSVLGLYRLPLLCGTKPRHFSHSIRRRDGMWPKIAVWDNFQNHVTPPPTPPITPPLPFSSIPQPLQSFSQVSSDRLFDEDFFKQLNSVDATPLSPNIEGKPSFLAIEIDTKGIASHRTIEKSELLGNLRIQARDLRSIDVTYPHQMASLLVREKSLIVKMSTLRAAVQWDKLLIFTDGREGTKLIESVVFYLREFLSNTTEKDQQQLPFEFKALEAILISSCELLDKQVSSLQPLLDGELRALQTNPEHHLLNIHLYHYKKHLAKCEVTAKEIHDALGDILQSDEDMAAMYLSTKAFTGYPRRKNQHQEIEILLENYMRQIEQVRGLIKEIRETVAVAEDYINLQLDSVRNRMMRYSLVLTVGTVSTSIGGVVTGTFGMNLHTGLESNPYAFFLVSGFVVTCASTVFLLLRHVFGIRYLASPALLKKPRKPFFLKFGAKSKTYDDPPMSI